MCNFSGTRPVLRPSSALILLTATLAWAQPVAPPPVAITNVTVIDVLTGARRPGLTVLTREGRISAIGRKVAIPPGATRL